MEDKKVEPTTQPTSKDLIHCNGCRGEINIHSYRTYYTKYGVYCKRCVEDLPGDDEEESK